MTDVEMATYVPRFDLEYKQQFKMKELLPGDKWCLMNQVRNGDGGIVLYVYAYSVLNFLWYEKIFSIYFLICLILFVAWGML